MGIEISSKGHGERNSWTLLDWGLRGQSLLVIKMGCLHSIWSNHLFPLQTDDRNSDFPPSPKRPLPPNSPRSSPHPSKLLRSARYQCTYLSNFPGPWVECWVCNKINKASPELLFGAPPWTEPMFNGVLEMVVSTRTGFWINKTGDSSVTQKAPRRRANHGLIRVSTPNKHQLFQVVTPQFQHPKMVQMKLKLALRKSPDVTRQSLPQYLCHRLPHRWQRRPSARNLRDHRRNTRDFIMRGVIASWKKTKRSHQRWWNMAEMCCQDIDWNVMRWVKSLSRTHSELMIVAKLRISGVFGFLDLPLGPHKWI